MITTLRFWNGLSIHMDLNTHHKVGRSLQLCLHSLPTKADLQFRCFTRGLQFCLSLHFLVTLYLQTYPTASLSSWFWECLNCQSQEYFRALSPAMCSFWFGWTPSMLHFFFPSYSCTLVPMGSSLVPGKSRSSLLCKGWWVKGWGSQQGGQGPFPHWQGVHSHSTSTSRAEQAQWWWLGSAIVQRSAGPRPSQEVKAEGSKSGWAKCRARQRHIYNVAQTRSKGLSIKATPEQSNSWTKQGRPPARLLTALSHIALA